MGGFLWKEGLTFGRGRCKSMSGLEFTSSGSRVTDGSRSLIGLEFWTNGGGSVVGIGDF